MIELKDLTEEERYSILRGCEPFTISQSRATWMRHVINKLVPLYGNEQELWVLATAAAKAIRYGGDRSIFSFNHKKYTKTYTGSKYTINYDNMRALIQLMELQGLLTAYIGCTTGDLKGLTYWESCIHFHDKFLSLFPREKCMTYSQARVMDNISVLDLEKSTKKTPVDKSGYQLSGLAGIQPIRTSLENYNKLLAESDIYIAGDRAVALYFRKFHDNLEKHGRFYTASTLQSERSLLRKSITINGNKTCEIDYSTMHPRILAELNGYVLPPDYDCYSVDVKTTLEPEVIRKLCKMALLLILNSGSKGQAYSSLAKYTRDESIPHDKVLIHSIIDKMIKNNKHISDHFFNKELWMKLQNIDSNIAAHIIDHFTKQGIPSLAYHDSFVVSYDKRDELSSVMFSAWEAVLGSNANCRVKIAYDNSPIAE